MIYCDLGEPQSLKLRQCGIAAVEFDGVFEVID